MLENFEIGEQKRRDEAYKAAKKKTGIYDDKYDDSQCGVIIIIILMLHIAYTQFSET